MPPLQASCGLSVNRHFGVSVGFQRELDYCRKSLARLARAVPTGARREPKLEVCCSVNPIGVHALTWVGGWSEKECRLAASGSAKLGYGLVEVSAFISMIG